MAQQPSRRQAAPHGRPVNGNGPRPVRQPQRRARPGERPPAHASHAPQAAQRRSIVPAVVVSLLILVFVGLLTFFVIRACTSGGSAGAGQGGAQQGVAADGSTAEASAVPVDDGSVDINLMMVGDILFHYQVRMSGLRSDGTRNYDHVFAHVLDELADQDIKVLNQETPLGGAAYGGTAPDGFSGYPEFNGPQEMADAEAKAGFNVVLKATNHAMDNSGNYDDHYALMRSERSYWKSNYPNIAVIGQADPDDPTTSASDVYVFEKDGFKVALLNYTQDLNGNEVNDGQGLVSMLESEHVQQTMAQARELADMIVVFPHWGEEYNLEPVAMQREWAQVFADAGADVIIGNHPHVIEPVETVVSAEGKVVPCYWSTGNFISTSPSDESLVGGMAKVVLHKEADGTCSVTSAVFKPLISHLGLSTDMTTYMISDWTDELAASNWLDTDVNPSTDNTTLTPAWANSFCSQVLGSGYDATTGTFTLDLTTPAQTVAVGTSESGAPAPTSES